MVQVPLAPKSKGTMKPCLAKYLSKNIPQPQRITTHLALIICIISYQLQPKEIHILPAPVCTYVILCGQKGYFSFVSLCLSQKSTHHLPDGQVTDPAAPEHSRLPQ